MTPEAPTGDQTEISSKRRNPTPNESLELLLGFIAAAGPQGWSEAGVNSYIKDCQLSFGTTPLSGIEILEARGRIRVTEDDKGSKQIVFVPPPEPEDQELQSA